MPDQDDRMSIRAAQLATAIQQESCKFEDYYLWLEQTMPPSFFDDISQENRMLVTHNLMGFHLQEYFSTIHLKRMAIILCLDSADADLRILANYAFYGIKHYQAYISHTPPPLPGIAANLRIAIIYFTETIDTNESPYAGEDKERLRLLIKQRNPDLNTEEFEKLLTGIQTKFLRSLPLDRLILALDLFFRAKTHDNCQYEVRYPEEWETKGTASMEIVLAWRNTPKHNFLYRLARTIHRHGLVMKRVNATYINPYAKQNILIMSLGLHGSKGEAAWEVADIPDFLRELVTVKYFAGFDAIEQQLISKKIISGNMGNILRAMVHFIHQALVHIDANLYTLENVEEGICKHGELTAQLAAAFKCKFDPDYVDYASYLTLRQKFLLAVSQLDTGQEEVDNRRKTILSQGMNFIHYTLKTNFYRTNYTALSFRLDPAYLDHIPFDRIKKFPELPYAIFFIKGMHFFGFHIRFKDLARGGLRTVFPDPDHFIQERNHIFTECYNLAYTQHKKNKDIPEGGAKGIIFLRPFDRLESEALILKNELEAAKLSKKEREQQLETFRQEQIVEYLHQAQRSYIESLITIVNCEPDGKIRAKYIIDYWKQPEYIYMGPDENMHDEMIQWIADFSRKYGYKPGSSFISGKPNLGINHKEYGVTSLGINVCLEAVLKYLEIDPSTQPFTIKMSGGPDGDVAGNQICNLYKYYPLTAKLIALTDVSGTIYDPEGLQLAELVKLFKQGYSIRHYPPHYLHEEGFLLDKDKKRNTTGYSQQTLCWRKKEGRLIEDWLSGNDMNQLYRHNIFKTVADVFIPGGGRPRTLHDLNFSEFLDDKGQPTAKAIIEGANLYLTSSARLKLEQLGVLIIKDSSANKTGVICSSFEVLCGLSLGDANFLKYKPVLVQEILERLRACASHEVHLLLQTYKETSEPMSLISDKISERINQFTYQLLDYFDSLPLPHDPQNPMVKKFLDYCLPILQHHFTTDLIEQIPEHHKKAIIACHIASQLVYLKGLNWLPTVVDILPLLIKD